MSFLNRLGNCKNLYQGDTKRVLCVCSAGLLRSPTAAKVLAEEYGYNTRAAGTAKEYALIPVDRVLVEWADEIVIMQEDMRVDILHLTIDKPIVCLDIPDVFGWNDKNLVELIKKNYKEHLDAN